MFKFLLASFLSSIYFLYGLTVNNGWSLYGSGNNEINLSSTFSQYSNISYVWTYSNGVWSGYGNNSGLKTKLSNAKITQINLIKPYTGFWILNGADSVDINLSINGSNANIVLGKDWNLVSSGGSKVDFNRTFGTNPNVLIIWNWDNEKKIWKAFSNNELIKNAIKYNNITETAFSDEVSAFWVLNFSDSNITFQTATVPTFKNFEFWGEWKSIDKNETIYVTSLTDKTIEKITENLIKIDSGYYLKNGERNVTISGSLDNDGSGEDSNRILNSLTMDRFAQALVKLRNQRDPNINATIKVNANGTFKDSSLPTGNYILTATNNDKSIETNVSLERDQKELGTFKLVPKGIANLQINFELNNSEFLYGNGENYSGSIVIKNIGDAIGIGLAYESINIDGSKSLSINSSKTFGSIPINGEKRIPISFSFNEQNSNEKYYVINISIKDSSNRFWYEHVTIPVYKTTFELNLDSQVNLRGSLKYPNGKILNLDSKSEISMSLPTFAGDKKYILQIVNYGDFNEEGVYGLATNSEVSTSDFPNFSDTAAFEPNDDFESNSTIIKVGESQVTSYISYENTDYFAISVPENNKTVEELNNTAPTVELSISTSSASTSSTIIFYLSGSDNVGIVKYELRSSINGLLYSGINNQVYTNLSEGNHTITLTAFDEWGASNSKIANITIYPQEPLSIETDSYNTSGYFSDLYKLSAKNIGDQNIANYKWVVSNKDYNLTIEAKSIDLNLTEGEWNISLTTNNQYYLASKTINVINKKAIYNVSVSISSKGSNWDIFGGSPDISADLTFGGTQYYISEKSNSNSHSAIFNNVILENNSYIDIYVNDVDISYDDSMGNDYFYFDKNQINKTLSLSGSTVSFSFEKKVISPTIKANK